MPARRGGRGGAKDPKGVGGPAMRMTPRQELFAAEYVRLGDAEAAYRAAGYKSSTQGGIKFLDPDRYPLVVARVAELREKRDRLCGLDGAGVLRYTHEAMTVCLVDYFEPGGDGGWLIDVEGFRRLPREVKQLIEEVEIRSVEVGNSRVTKVWCRTVSKALALGIAAKYQLVPPGGKGGDGSGPGGAGAAPAMDWDRLMGRKREERPDPVEARILALEAAAKDRAENKPAAG